MKDNRERIVSDVEKIIKKIISKNKIDISEIDFPDKTIINAYKNRLESIKLDILDIFCDLLNDIDIENYDEAESGKKKISDYNEKLINQTQTEQDTLSKDNLSSFNKSIFRLFGSFLKQISVINGLTSGKKTNTIFFINKSNIQKSISYGRFLTNLTKNKILSIVDKGILSKFRRIEKIKSIQNKLQQSKNRFKIFGQFVTNKLKSVKKQIGKISKRLLFVGRIGFLGLRSMWKTGAGRRFMAFGAKSIFNLGQFLMSGLFSITKNVIGSVFSFTKGLTKTVIGTVSGITKSIMQPLLPMLFKFLMTPQGAFTLGFVAHAIESSFIKKFNMTDIFDFETIQHGASKLLNSIKQKISKFNYQDILYTLKDFGTNKFFPLMREIIEGFLPENLMWRGIKSLAGNVLGWATYSPIITKALFGFVSNPALMSGALFLGVFAHMGKQLGDTISVVQDKDRYNKLGIHYSKQYASRYETLRNSKKRNDGGFLDRNRNLILEASKSGYWHNGPADFGNSVYHRKYVGQVLKEAVENGAKQDRDAKELDEIIDFVRNESEILDSERMSIIDAASKTKDKQLDMAYDIMINHNGHKYITDLLPEDVQNPIEFRTKNLLARMKLLEVLKERGFKNGDISAKDEIKKYKETVDKLAIINGGKAEIDENLLGDKLKLYTLNQNDKRGVKVKTIGGFEMMDKNAYYGFKEDTDGVSWNDADQVQQAINFTIGNIMQESDMKNTKELYDISNTDMKFTSETAPSNVQFDDGEMMQSKSSNTFSITKEHFLEMCDIFVNMFCGVQSNIRIDSYSRPQNPRLMFAKICNSRRFKESKLKYNPQNKDMVEFFDMLFDNSKDFEKYFGSIIASHTKNALIANNYRILGVSSQIPDKGELVSLTDEVGAYSDISPEMELYRYHTMSLIDYKLSDKEVIRKINTRSGGNKYCYLVKVTNQVPGTVNRRGESKYPRAILTIFDKNMHQRLMESLFDDLYNFLYPYFEKFNEIKGKIKPSDNKALEIGNNNPLANLMSTLDDGIRKISSTVSNIKNGIILSDEVIEGDRIKKAKLREDIQTKIKKIQENVKGNSDEVCTIINTVQDTAQDKKQKTGSKKSATDRKETNLKVVQVEDKTNENNAIIQARKKSNEAHNEVDDIYKEVDKLLEELSK